ncbi:helix-turn-helix transcriptional regulator [Dyella soli]|uniref:Helix-turn-helix transcriptional regulator n=1 Tax=Dyella soli TaxID=522319 RepID=A0A4R0YM99_9GAMM|nr:helix-turn-helix transcriptional regulator [Dyella soli]TCI06879.1 helix-turn-helix transcriptional regulator [Dyella soli]
MRQLPQPMTVHGHGVQPRPADAAADPVLAQVLDQLPTGVVLVDAASRLCYANREARDILATRDGLADSPAGLAATSAADTRRLRQALALMGMAIPGAGDSSAPRYLCLPRAAPRAPPLLLRLLALPGPPARTVVFITAPEHLPPVSREAMMAIFGLTPREAALAGLLADGHELRDCAQLLAIGEGTARNHLKHVFEKTAKHSQVALVAQLCRLAGTTR